jgi:hypothetical protein
VIEKDLHARPLCDSCLEPAGAALASERRQHPFDVLARAEPVDVVVDAPAGILAAREVSRTSTS